MKKTLLSTALIGLVTANICAMDPDNQVMDKLIRHGTYTELDISTFIVELSHKTISRVVSIMDTYGELRIQGLFESMAKNHFSKALEIFRNDNYTEPLTIKNLRNSICRFLDKNGLNDLYQHLSIKDIEILDVNFIQNNGDLQTKYALKNQDGATILQAQDYQSGVNLFRDSRFNDIKIGTRRNNYERLYGLCDYNVKSNLSTISMCNTLEAYDSIFAHESGHAYQHFVYPELTNMRYKIREETGNKDHFMYLSSEIIAWMFEFRYLLEKETLNKGDAVALGVVLPKMLYSKTPTISYYFTNYALSMASQMDKKLVDLANAAIADIKNILQVPYNSRNLEFSGVSDVLDGEYGIDSDLTVRFNAEKNRGILRELLTKMGYSTGSTIDRIDCIVKEEHRLFINQVLEIENV